MMDLDLSIGYGYLPICWAFFTCFTFVLCYGVAVSNGHIYPFVPAISDTGAQIPEANLFSEFFNLSNVLLFINVWIRYLQFNTITRGLDSSELLLARLNKLGFVFGVGIALGGTIVANFPSTEEANMVYFHDVGAVMLFGSGALYCWAQTLMTYKASLLGLNSVLVFVLRLLLTCVLTVFGSLFFVAEMFAFDDFRYQTQHTVAMWSPEDPGYGLHVLSNVSEWISAVCFGLFGITFFNEFQKISLSVECNLKIDNAARDRRFSDYTSLDSNTGDE